jgi:glutamate 5-kinase
MRNLGIINRIVVKVGTSVVTNPDGSINEGALGRIVDVCSKLRYEGKVVTLVTCGAVGMGVTKMRLPHFPTEMQEKQASSAVGQPLLMAMYEKHFGRHGITVAQLLLTKYTVQRDDTLSNVTNTMNTLFAHGVVPIINENDPVISDEIKLGDNDTLAAHVANIIKADLLLLLTDVDGLYNKDPNLSGAKVIPEVTAITEEIKAGAVGTKSARSTGGMATKLTAAVIASKTKTKTVIMNGSNPDLINEVLKGARLGTYFDLLF